MRNHWLVALAVLLFLVLTVRAQAQTKEGPAYLGIIAGADEAAGVLVREVTPGSPADRAGLRPGDLIIKAGDKELKSYDNLAGVVAGHKPGDKLSLHVRRDGKE